MAPTFRSAFRTRRPVCEDSPVIRDLRRGSPFCERCGVERKRELPLRSIITRGLHEGDGGLAR